MGFNQEFASKNSANCHIPVPGKMVEWTTAEFAEFAEAIKRTFQNQRRIKGVAISQEGSLEVLELSNGGIILVNTVVLEPSTNSEQLYKPQHWLLNARGAEARKPVSARL